MLTRFIAGFLDYFICFILLVLLLKIENFYSLPNNHISEYFLILLISLMDIKGVFPGKKLLNLKLINKNYGSIKTRKILIEKISLAPK